MLPTCGGTGCVTRGGGTGSSFASRHLDLLRFSSDLRLVDDKCAHTSISQAMPVCSLHFGSCCLTVGFSSLSRRSLLARRWWMILVVQPALLYYNPHAGIKARARSGVARSGADRASVHLQARATRAAQQGGRAGGRKAGRGSALSGSPVARRGAEGADRRHCAHIAGSLGRHGAPGDKQGQ